MPLPADAIRDARRNLGDAERALQSIDESLRRHDAELARIRDWISTATSDLKASSAAGDASTREQALQSLAQAHDSRSDFEGLGDKFAQLQRTARSTADRARQLLREAESLTDPEPN